MPSLYRELGLSLYQWATTRSRQRFAESFRAENRFPGVVLFYHRVCAQSLNDWSIHRDNFERHLDWISDVATFVSLDEVRASQTAGRRSEVQVAVTIDDGYAENMEHAIPALLSRKIPCSYFVATHHIESGEPFAHDLQCGRPSKPNSIEQVQSMASQGIEIGAHSHTHINFGQALSKAILRREITDVRKKLQDWTGQSIDYFAFPYGLSKNISQQAIDVVFESGFKCFLSASGGLNWPGQDSSHLQRVHGDPGMAALKNWLTFDPRKVGMPSPFEFEVFPNELTPVPV
jgi:peptidoglycan/xylan/chitin deacetylase (PgdA/CDA1 family)